MCNTPLEVYNRRDKTVTKVQCRKCETCLQARKRQWVGRILAEMQTCQETWFTTHTYGGGYENGEAYWIDYADIQKMFKRLRKDGYKFKYIAVGEYGEKRSRGHFHLMLFWQSDPPPVSEMNERIQFEYWPHGYSQIEYPRSGQGSAAYIMDYMNKANLKEAVMKYSKNPMLGSEYLQEYARKTAREGLALFAQGDRFTIPGNLNRNGEMFYYAVGRTTGIYPKMMEAYLEEWAIHRPDQRLPTSEDLTDYILEASQNPERWPAVTQRYFENIYDISAVADHEEAYYIVTHYCKGNVTFSNDPTFVLAEIIDQHGERIWHGHVTNEFAGTQRLVLSEQQLSRLQKMLREKVPKNLHKYLSDNPPESIIKTPTIFPSHMSNIGKTSI